MTGKELRTARRRLRMTQRELARALGVHPQTLSQWERGDPIQHPPMLRLALDMLILSRDRLDGG